MTPLTGSLEAAPEGRVPPVYITKYNRYVDTILERVNKVLRNGYDPVNVRLHTVKNNNKKNQGKKKNNKNKGKKPGKKGGKGKKKNKNKNKNNKKQNRLQEEAIARAITEAILNGTDETTIYVTEPDFEVTTIESVTIPEVENTTKAEVLSGTKAETASRARPQKKKNNNNKNKNKKDQNSKPRAKATLYGLATLKRMNDVTVNLMSTHNTIKSRFYIGPLTLKVEKEFGRGAKKELRSATATTTEMIGKLNLRVMHGGNAILHSIRVMQPNLLRVDSPDDHDKTREFVWRRSSHIAQIVSQKLTKATRSLLHPSPPKPAKKKPSSGVFSFFGI